LPAEILQVLWPSRHACRRHSLTGWNYLVHDCSQRVELDSMETHGCVGCGMEFRKSFEASRQQRHSAQIRNCRRLYIACYFELLSPFRR